jgi:uncharacterized GH25 family protein
VHARSRLFALALLIASPAAAHDFWIEPSSFHPAEGARITTGLRVGMHLLGDPVPRIPELVDKFFIRGNGDERAVVGRAGMEPAGIAFVSGPGLHWVGYQSFASPLNLDAKKFADYLRDEGLPNVPQGPERFYRCAKALLDTPGDSGKVLDTPLGFTLELIPRKNPYTSRELLLTLLFRGKPLANAQIVALNGGHEEKVRTDARGRATIRTARTGLWLIKAVHMEPAPKGSGSMWESWWASLTFEATGETLLPR